MRLSLPFFALMTAFAAFMPVLPARAQDGGYVLGKDTMDYDAVSLASVDFESAFSSIESPFLSDMMKLNYQISLLEKMVSRQAELTKISESYSSLGISYQPPPPPRGICAQLPANAACLKAYPELYADLVEKRKAMHKSPDAAAPSDNGDDAAAQEEAARLAREDAMRREAEAKAERAGRYHWTDISCKAGSCRGVIVTSSGDGFRATVRKGSKLVDGTVVESVSAEGIRVVIEGDSIALRPQTGEGSGGAGNAVAAALGGSGVSATAANGATASGTAAPKAAASTINAVVNGGASGGVTSTGAGASGGAAGAASGDAGISATAQGQSVAQPALGPSGLF